MSDETLDEPSLIVTLPELLIEDGSESLPGIRFSNDLDTGMYRVGDNRIGLVAGGTRYLTLDTDLLTIDKPIAIVDEPANAPTTATVGHLYKKAGSDGLFWNTLSTGEVDLRSAATVSFPVLANPTGTAAAPAFSFTGDADTGMYRDTADTISFAVNSANAANVDTSGIDVTGRYGFTSASTTGMYLSGSDLVLQRAGTSVLTLESAKFVVDSDGVEITETAEGSISSATVGSQMLFFSSDDNNLKKINSSGTITDLEDDDIVSNFIQVKKSDTSTTKDLGLYGPISPTEMTTVYYNRDQSRWEFGRLNTTTITDTVTITGYEDLYVKDLNCNDLIVGGDLTVSGTTTTINTATLQVDDNIIEFAINNTATDVIDFGIVGYYGDAGAKYATIYRDASDGEWYIKNGLSTTPTTTIPAEGSLANLNVGNLSSTGNITVTGTVDGVDIASLAVDVSTNTSDIATVVADVDGFPDRLKFLTTAEINQLENIGTSTISASQWGYVGVMDQSVTTSDSVQFASVVTTGNVGIGETTPARKLEVSIGTGAPQMRLTHTDGIDYAEFYTDGSGNFTFNNTSGVGYYEGTGTINTTSTFIITDDQDNIARSELQLRTVGSGDYSTIQSFLQGTGETDLLLNYAATGKVGIGVTAGTSPAGGLEVLNASTQLRLTETAATNYADFTVDSSGNLTIVSSAGYANVAGTDIVFDVSGNTTDAEGMSLQVDYSNAATSSRVFFRENSSNLFGFSLIHTAAANPTFDSTAFTLEDDKFYFIKHNNSATGTMVGSIDASGNWLIGKTGLAQAKMHIFDSANTQLRLENTDGLDFCDFNVDASGVLNIDPSGAVIDIAGSITLTGTVDGVDIAALQTDVDGFPDALKNLTTAEINQLENIDTTTISAAQWGYLGNMDQDVITSSTVEFAGLGVGTASPDVLVEFLSSSTQLRLTNTDGIDYADFTVDLSGDLDIAPTGGTVGITGAITSTGAVNGLTVVQFGYLDAIANDISATQWGYLGNMDQNVSTTDNVTFNAVNSINSTELAQLTNIDTTTISVAQWGYLGNMDQDVITSSTVEFAGLGVGTASPDTLVEFLSTSTQLRLTHTDAVNYADFTVDLSGDLTIVPSGGNVGVTGNITVTGTVDGVDVAALKTDVDGFPDALKNLVTAEINQLENIGVSTISATQWGYLGNMDQDVITTSDVVFNSVNSINSTELSQLTNIDTTTISSTQWGYLGAMDQSVATTDTVEFTSLGVGTASPDDLVEFLSTSTQLRLTHTDAVNYAQFTVDASGDLTIAPSGTTVTIGGNLTVTGTTTTVDSVTLTVTDNILELAKDNAADVTDLGWLAQYNDGVEKWAGMIRDASDGEFYIVENLTSLGEPVTTSDRASLNVENLDAAGTIDSTGAVNGLTVVQFGYLDSIANDVSATQWGYLGNMDQGVATTDTVQFTSLGVGTASPDVLVEFLSTSTQLRLTHTDAVNYADFTVDLSGDLTIEPSGGNFGVTGNIIVTGTVDGVDIAALQTDVDGFPDALKNLVTAEINQLENIGTTTISATQWGYLGNMDQEVITSSTPTFVSLNLAGTGFPTINFDDDTAQIIQFRSAAGVNQGKLQYQGASNYLGIYLNNSEKVRFNQTSADMYGSNVSTAEWGYLAAMDQSVATTSTPTFAGITTTAESNLQNLRIITSGGINYIQSNNGVGGDGDLYLTGVSAGIGSYLKIDFANVDIIGNLDNINGNAISSTQWGYLSALDQSLTTTSTVQFGDGTDTNQLVINGRLQVKSAGAFDSVLNLSSASYDNYIFTDEATGDLFIRRNTSDIQMTSSGVVFDQIISSVNGNSLTNTQWSYLAALDQSLTTTSAVDFSGVTVAGNIVINQDDSYFAIDTATPRIGFTKKSGSFSKLTFASGASLAIAESSGANIAASNTFTNVALFNSSGATITGELTVSSTFEYQGQIRAGHGTALTVFAFDRDLTAGTTHNFDFYGGIYDANISNNAAIRIGGSGPNFSRLTILADTDNTKGTISGSGDIDQLEIELPAKITNTNSGSISKGLVIRNNATANDTSAGLYFSTTTIEDQFEQVAIISQRQTGVGTNKLHFCVKNDGLTTNADLTHSVVNIDSTLVDIDTNLTYSGTLNGLDYSGLSQTEVDYLAALNQSLTTTSNVEFSLLTLESSNTGEVPIVQIIKNTTSGGCGIRFENSTLSANQWQVFLSGSSENFKIGRAALWDALVIDDNTGNITLYNELICGGDLRVDSNFSDVGYNVAAGSDRGFGIYIATTVFGQFIYDDSADRIAFQGVAKPMAVESTSTDDVLLRTNNTDALTIDGTSQDATFTANLTWNNDQRPLFISSMVYAVNVGTSYIACKLPSEGWSTNTITWQPAPRDLTITHIYVGQDDETSAVTYDVQVEIANTPPTVVTTLSRTGLTDTQEVMVRNSVTTFTITEGQYYRLSVKASAVGADSEEVWVQLEGYY